MKSFVSILTFILFLLNGTSGVGQSKYSYSVGANIFKGFIYQHSPSIGHLISDHPVGFEINLIKKTNGNKYWEQAYNYPEVGLSLLYVNYNNDILGQSIAAIPHWRFNLNNPNSAVSLKVYLGAGLVYNTAPFNKDSNIKNNVLSSTIAYAIRAGLLTKIRLAKRWSLLPSLYLTHFSNGALKMPNMGINIPTFNLGAEYVLSNNSYTNQSTAKPEINKRLHVNLAVSAGFTETLNNTSSGRHPYFNFSVYPDKRLNYKSAINSGFDLFINNAKKEDIENDPNIDSSDKPDYKRVGWVVGHELFLGRVTILTQLGTYLYNPYPSDGNFYQRVGVKYYVINEKLFLGLNLKTHFSVAEMAEWNLGIRL